MMKSSFLCFIIKRRNFLGSNETKRVGARKAANGEAKKEIMEGARNLKIQDCKDAS